MPRALRLAVLVLLKQLAAAAAAGDAGPGQKKRRRKDGKGFSLSDPTQAYGWSSYRFTRYDKKPHLQDKQASMLAGGDAKCDVCEVILTKVLQEVVKTKRLTGGPEDQEIIEEYLEADDEVDAELIQKTTNRMEKYVIKYKKGCNKHFKDNFLSLGWYIAPCHQQLDIDVQPQPPDGRVPWACARDAHQPPEDLDALNTYSVEREAAWYACEATITRHREELAKFVVGSWTDFKRSPPQKFAKEACRKGAKCLERKPTETVEARARKMVGLTNEKGDALEDQMKLLKKEMKREVKEKKKRRKDEKTRQKQDAVEL